MPERPGTPRRRAGLRPLSIPDARRIASQLKFRGTRVIGTVYGGIVYHNWFSAQGPPERRAEARQAWVEAVNRFLPPAV